MAQPDCIFCRIAAGDVPSHRLIDTADAVAFLDVSPIAEGHTLLIPRRHFATVDEMSPDEVASVVRHVPTLAAAILGSCGMTAFNVLQNNGRFAGQVVEHVHFHIIPRQSDDGLGYRWNAGSYSPGRAEELAASITRSLTS